MRIVLAIVGTLAGLYTVAAVIQLIGAMAGTTEIAYSTSRLAASIVACLFGPDRLRCLFREGVSQA